MMHGNFTNKIRPAQFVRYASILFAMSYYQQYLNQTMIIGGGTESQQARSRLNRDNTLIKFKSLAKLKPDASIGSMNNNTKNGVNYKLNNRGQAIFPMEEFLIYRNGPELAEIDMRPLLPYPEYQHHLHTKTYNTVNYNQQNQQTELIINFMPLLGISTQGIPVKLTFIDAELTHDTEMISKMDPYLRVKVNDEDKWRSKTAKEGGKFPNFNREFINLNLKNLKDAVSIEVWDEDLTRDDFVGQVILKAYQFVGRGSEIIEEPICYTKKQKMIPAGKIRFMAQTPNLT